MLVREESMDTCEFNFTKRAICIEAAAMFALKNGFVGVCLINLSGWNCHTQAWWVIKYVVKVKRQKKLTFQS